MGKKTTGKSKNPTYPDAHPTAPGGMSRPALVEEMVIKHGWDQAEATALKWPEQIKAVVQGRLAREAEQREQIMAEHDGEPIGEVETARATPVFADERGPEGYEPGDLVDVIHGRTEPAEPVAEVTDLNERQPQPMFLGMPDTLDFIFDGHAGAGPSGAERWMNCTASLGAARSFLETLTPNQQEEFARGSDAARQGTTAHAVGETKINLLLGNITVEEAEATLLELAILPPDGEAYDAEMDDHLSEYVDLVKQYADDGRTVLVEQKVHAAVPLAGDHDGDVHLISGSADLVVHPSLEENVLVVGDLKYGNGIDVDPDSNPQVRIYGLGVLSDLADEEGNIPDIDHIEYVIVQPRLGGIKVWRESVDDLLTWRDEVLSPALTAALYGPEAGAEFVPSDTACQWCPARGSCAALAEQRMEQAVDLFDAVIEAEFETGNLPDTSTLSDTRLGELLAQIEGLVSLKDDLKDEVQRRLHRGGAVPGYKLVSYTPPRKWTEDADTALDPDTSEREGLDAEMLTAIWTRALVTPKKALGALKAKGVDKPEAALAGLIDTPAKRPVAAREGDRRKDWEGVPPEQMFDDESGNAESESVA